MEPQSVQPVKLVIGALYTDAQILNTAQIILTKKFGRIDVQSPVYDFTISDYYCEEMGKPIFRIFFSHQNLILPNEIAQIKIDCNQIENDLAVAGKRKVNLDPGYMDYDKFVLASAKYNAQKVYLDLGIYADLTLHFEKGEYLPFPWSFPDFKSRIYEETFLKIRARFKGQRRKANKSLKTDLHDTIQVEGVIKK